jgi:putative acetyltransferase
MQIQAYTQGRSKQVVDLFHRSVHAISRDIYSDKQKQAWAPTPPDYEQWSARLLIKKPYLAIIEQKVAGFIELDPDGHIDCTYTDPVFQGLGVASALFNHIKIIAVSRGDKRLYVEASLVAKPLFEKWGFSLLHKNELVRCDTTLTNFTMELWLVPKP